MNTVTVPIRPPLRPGSDRHSRPAYRERRARRRQLERYDVLARRLAELHAVRALVRSATTVVVGGWVQGAWFAVEAPGGTRLVTAHDLDAVEQHPVVGACLVGAVVHAAGGPAQVRSQLVQRTLDLTWHALREEPDRPVQWCPAPAVRQLQVLDLTRWNDAPGRTAVEVSDLLDTACLTVDLQADRCRSERSALTG
jgi:hypothetical protein